MSYLKVRPHAQDLPADSRACLNGRRILYDAVALAAWKDKSRRMAASRPRSDRSRKKESRCRTRSGAPIPLTFRRTSRLVGGARALDRRTLLRNRAKPGD